MPLLPALPHADRLRSRCLLACVSFGGCVSVLSAASGAHRLLHLHRLSIRCEQLRLRALGDECERAVL